MSAKTIPPTLPLDPNEVAFNSDVATFGMLGVYIEYIQVIKYKTQSKLISSQTIQWLNGHGAAEWILAAATVV
jgi:hypothetical protein